jgi:hypothetical protein
VRALGARTLPLFAVAVLIVNDHVLKHRFPGLVTGKLSDFAGLFFFPLLLVDAIGLLGVRRAPRVIASAPLPALARVRLTMDATDVVALVSVAAAFWYARAARAPASLTASLAARA